MKIKCEIGMEYLLSQTKDGKISLADANEVINQFAAPAPDFREISVIDSTGFELYITETKRGFSISCGGFGNLELRLRGNNCFEVNPEKENEK